MTTNDCHHPAACTDSWLQRALVHGCKLHAILLELNFQACTWLTCCQNCRKAYGVLREALQHAANLQGTLLELNFRPDYLQCCEEEEDDDEVVCLN